MVVNFIRCDNGLAIGLETHDRRADIWFKLLLTTVRERGMGGGNADKIMHVLTLADGLLSIHSNFVHVLKCFMI